MATEEQFIHVKFVSRDLLTARARQPSRRASFENMVVAWRSSTTAALYITTMALKIHETIVEF